MFFPCKHPNTCQKEAPLLFDQTVLNAIEAYLFMFPQADDPTAPSLFPSVHAELLEKARVLPF